ncbi:MAG: hypothetical protein M1825_006513 [Sarcosagium campestre]|nr:MAG: hypothetical protein M1825_006513 [Sarcosagium campestre]
MPSPTSPRTPSHRRKKSSPDFSATSNIQQYADTGPYHISNSRRSSLQTPTTPHTPGASFSAGLNGSHSMSSDLANAGGGDLASGGGGGIGGEGLGSLADELADAWGDEYEDGIEEDEEGEDVEMHEDLAHDNGVLASSPPTGRFSTHDSGIDLDSSPALEKHAYDPLSSSPTIALRTNNRRRQSHFHTPDTSSTLDARIKTIENLARHGGDEDPHGIPSCTEEDARDGTARLVDRLRDLGGQAPVESGTTRLINAHTALTAHLTHQTRTLHSLAYPLLSPLSAPPSESTIDNLLPLLSATTTHLPTPSPDPLSSLHTLTSLTDSLLHTLAALSDSLHESRHTTTAASRKLRGTLELVRELRREHDEAEQARVWLERGRWDERLRGRECGAVARDVVGGFEDVCRGWREWIERGGEGEVVAAG